VREMDVVVLLEEEEAEEGTGEAEEPTEAPEHGTVHGRMPEVEAAAEEPTEAPEQAASRVSFDSPGSPISQASGLADGVLHVHVE
jgi:histone deacetylase complex regulatory component SIN3